MAKKVSKRLNLGNRIRKAAVERHNSTNIPYLKSLGDLEIFKTEDGVLTFDILPYIVKTEGHSEGIDVGEVWFRMPYGIHRKVGAEDTAVVCCKYNPEGDRRCPVCEAVAQLRTDYAENKDLITEMRTKERDLYVVRDYRDNKMKLFDVSTFLFGEMLDSEVENQSAFRGEVADFVELEGGLTLRVRFKKKPGGSYEFVAAERIDFVERKEDYTEDILDEIPDLASLLDFKTYDEVQFMLYGVSNEDGGAQAKRKTDKKPVEEIEEIEETTEDDAPPATERKSGASRFTKKRTEPVEEPEEQPAEEPEEPEEEPAEEPEEPEEKPAPKPKPKTRAKPKPEPEPEEEPEPGSDEIPECFGKEPNEREECDACELFMDCWKKKRGKK